jgi:hypothetical protein
MKKERRKMSNNESYQNDIDRLADRVLLVLSSLEGAPGIDQEILHTAGKFLGMGFAALDAANSPEKSADYQAWKAQNVE